MKTPSFILSMCLLAVTLCGCGVRQATPLQENSALPLATPTFSFSPSAGLFADTEITRDLPAEPHITRSRFVKVNLGQLLDETGQARNVKEITFNLFPDVVYIGVVEQVEQSGDSYTWSGYLQDVEYSYFTMVYTSGVFMGHFASPQGIYEAVFVEDGLYRVIEIDQTKFPGGEG